MVHKASLYSLLVFSFLLLLPALAQTKSKIPGTDINIYIPEGFSLSSSFSGLENPDTGAFILTTVLDVPYETLSESFTTERLASRGMTLKSREEIPLKDGTATLLVVEQFNPVGSETLEKLLYIFGTTERTCLVTGGYSLQLASKLKPSVKKALLSSELLEASAGVDTEGLPFSWEEQEELKPAKRIQNALIFSPDGAPPPLDVFLVVAPSFAKVEFQDIEQYAQNQLLKTSGFEDLQITKSEKIETDLGMAWQLEAQAIDSQDKTKVGVYQYLFWDRQSHRTLRAVGQSQDTDFSARLPHFKALVQSLKLLLP